MNQDNDSQMDPKAKEVSTSQEPATQPTKQSAVSLPQPSTSHPEPMRSRRKMILIAASIVVVLTIIGGLSYLLAEEYTNHKEDVLNPTQTEMPQETVANAERIIGELKSVVTGDQQKVDATTIYGATGSADGPVYMTASHQTADQKFAIYPANSFGLGTMSTDEVATSDLIAIESYLTSNKFSENGEATSGNARIFTSDDTVCTVQFFDSATNGRGGVGIGCAEMSDYEQSYQALLPFYTAYIENDSKFANNRILSSPLINDGVRGYKNASVSIGSSLPDTVGGFLGLFYYTPSQSAWKYLEGTQDQPSCDEFSTSEIKKAFSGQECYDTTTNSSIKIVNE